MQPEVPGRGPVHCGRYATTGACPALDACPACPLSRRCQQSEDSSSEFFNSSSEAGKGKGILLVKGERNLRQHSLRVKFPLVAASRRRSSSFGGHGCSFDRGVSEGGRVEVRLVTQIFEGPFSAVSKPIFGIELKGFIAQPFFSRATRFTRFCTLFFAALLRRAGRLLRFFLRRVRFPACHCVE